MAGLNVDVLGKWTLIIGNVTNFVVALSVIRIPKLFPEAWARSPFHVSDTMLKLMLGGTALTLAIQARMNLKGLSMLIIGFNATSFVVFFGIASALYKAGKITMKPSYELVA